jgi:hypothetical protein
LHGDYKFEVTVTTKIEMPERTWYGTKEKIERKEMNYLKTK